MSPSIITNEISWRPKAPTWQLCKLNIGPALDYWDSFFLLLRMNVPLNLKNSTTFQKHHSSSSLQWAFLVYFWREPRRATQWGSRQNSTQNPFSFQNKTETWLYVTPKQKQEKLLNYVAYFTPGRNTKMQQYNVFIMFCPKRIHAALAINVCNTGMYPENTTVFNFCILWVIRQLNLGEFYSYLLAWCVFVQSQPAFFVCLHVCYFLCVSCTLQDALKDMTAVTHTYEESVLPPIALHTICHLWRKR